MFIKAITLWQPWASFMAWGLKKNETRSWATSYRGPLAIHAAANSPRDYPIQLLEFAPTHMGLVKYWPKGVILCVVDLVECIKISGIISDPIDRETMMGDYSKGRFIWLTKMIEVFNEPIPCKGHQGLWDWEWNDDAHDHKGGGDGTREMYLHR